MKHQMRRATQLHPTGHDLTDNSNAWQKKNTHTHETKTILTKSTLKLGFWFDALYFGEMVTNSKLPEGGGGAGHADHCFYSSF